MQHYLYPFVLLAFAWLLSRTKHSRLARYVPLLIIPWVFGGALKAGYFSGLRTKPAVFFISPIPLSGGSEEFGLYRRFQTLSKFFRFPSVTFIERDFGSDARLLAWQTKLPSGSIALRVHDGIFTVNMPLYSDSTDPPDLNELVQIYQLSQNGRQFISLPNDTTGADLLLGMPAQSILISARSPEQSLHFVGWLAKVSSSWVWNTAITEDNRLAAITELQKIEDSAAQLHTLSGWNNNSAKIICRLVQGNILLLEAMIQGGNNQKLIERAARRYGSANKLLKRNRVPELESVLRNNLAITRYLLAENKKDIRKTRKEFLKAIAADKKSKTPSVGARLALVNLAQIAL